MSNSWLCFVWSFDPTKAADLPYSHPINKGKRYNLATFPSPQSLMCILTYSSTDLLSPYLGCVSLQIMNFSRKAVVQPSKYCSLVHCGISVLWMIFWLSNCVPPDAKKEKRNHSTTQFQRWTSQEGNRPGNYKKWHGGRKKIFTYDVCTAKRLA